MFQQNVWEELWKMPSIKGYLKLHLQCRDDDYKYHVKCLSEDQKYGGKNYEAKVLKGDVKQQEWIQVK